MQFVHKHNYHFQEPPNESPATTIDGKIVTLFQKTFTKDRNYTKAFPLK